MAKRMLLDAGHPDETRVVVLDGNRLDEFDYETRTKKQLKGNIYLAKVTRVEPSLQAAFVDYGGNRHGFLPFSEIHPDYYRLPIADREALLAEEEQLRSDAAEEADAAEGTGSEANGGSEPADAAPAEDARDEVEQFETATSVETLGGDEMEEAARRRAQLLRRYKIQEVIKRRQVILVQVVKEERGTKGAALTTYLSLAGRYCVLMPNTAKGGGISRKISNPADRRRLKQILAELKIPEGMAVIVRTAGSQRNKTEIKRDYEYLLRLWDEVRATTLESTAPSLIYEEANLIKRAIRDLYTREMEEVLVEGEEGYKAAKRFMRNLMPSHAKKVKQYKDPAVPLFQRHQVEGQLDNIHNPSVQLKSGGYIVINQTEALVAIDVNSGRATKERHIEETALKTNLEAADEVARQLKLRDLAGLIVVDFIDMDTARHNREVEQKLKEAMRQDRARIQLGRISPFGLLELSRQRLRPSLHETSTEVCSTCGGSGFVRSPESTAMHVLRGLEEEGIKRGGGELQVALPSSIALFLVNQKRERLQEIEQRYGFRVVVDIDDRLVAPTYRLNRLSTTGAPTVAEAVPAEEVSAEAPVAEAEGEKKRGRRRRPRRKRSDEAAATEAATEDTEVAEAPAQGGEAAAEAQGEEESEEKSKRRRRRGKRGGRRRSRRREDVEQQTADEAETPAAAAAGEGEGGPAPGEPAAGEAVPAAPAGAETAEGAEASQAGAEASATPADEPAEVKPKRRRSPSRRKSPGRKPAKTAESGEETAKDAQAVEEGREPAAETAPTEEAPAKPKRRRPSRARKKPAAAEPAEAQPKEAQASAEVSSGDGRDGAGAERAEAPASAGSGGGGNGSGELADSGERERESEREESKRPKRRGWWSRMLS